MKLFDIMDTTNCNLSNFGGKVIVIRFCEAWNRILKACIAFKPEGDEKWKPRNSINMWSALPDIYYTFLKNVQKIKISKFSNLRFLRFFFSSKAWNLPKTLKILFFVIYDMTYIQNTGNDNNYLNLPIKLKYYALLFWRVYLSPSDAAIPFA